MKKKTRVLFYFSHKETLGHTTRILSLATEISKRYPSTANIYILQAGIPQPFISFSSRIKIIHIPKPFDSRLNFKGIQHQRHILERATFILDQTKKIHPDIFITETLPFGRMEHWPELLPAITWLKQKKIKIIASIGYPMLSIQPPHQQKSHTPQQLSTFYDKILIHTPEKLENPYFEKALHYPKIKRAYASFLKLIAPKTIYTGYIATHHQPTKRRVNIQKNNTIVVSRGSGTFNPKIMSTAIQASGLFYKKYQFIIVCGPASTEKEKHLFFSCLKKYAPPRTKLFNYIPDLGTLIRKADVSISLSGYNTSMEIMQAGTPSIIIPYQQKNALLPTIDQLPRANLLKEKLGSTVIPYEELSAPALTKAIKEKLHQPRPTPAPQQWFKGAAVSAKIIMQEARR